MKIIYTSKMRKKAQVWDFIVEKSKGIYNKIRNIFRGDDEATQEAVNVEKETQEAEDFERLMGEEEIYRTLEEGKIPETQIGPDFLERYTPEQKEVTESLGDDIDIAYTTLYTGIYIPKRTIMPLYARFAESTGNYILVSWDYDMNDFRAFAISNISPVLETKNTI